MGESHRDPNYNLLEDIAVLPSGEAWAVGTGIDAPYPNVQHWDGTDWSLAALPELPAYSELYSVSAAAPDDIWAVGRSHLNGPPILHWDGTEWTVVPAPAGAAGSTLYDVVALSSTDAWAVGNLNRSFLRWNGSQWIVVPIPVSVTLTGVDGVASNDVWAVGATTIMHWDGAAWSQVPYPPEANGYITTVEAISTNDVWAIGYSRESGGGLGMALHWDGNAWSRVPMPQATSEELVAVAAASSNDVWAVGYSFWNGESSTLAMHWDGAQWSRVASPNPDPESNGFLGVGAVPGGEVWMVGLQGSIALGGTHYTLITRYTESCSQNTPSPSPTVNITATQTSTSTPATTQQPSPSMVAGTPVLTATPVPTGVASHTSMPSNTPMATITSCPVSFLDVPSNHTFYPFIRCLACHGIISGYNDGTFRPNNNITRGQIAKVVSNAAGFSEPVSGQTYEDVVPGATFYEWIERLSGRVVMGGYSCGGPGEPCVPPANRPYFRAGSPATRGQLSKIVSNAAGYSEPNTGQFYADVTSDNPFYPEIMRLTTRGAMSGYPCGGVGEPCDGEQRPYFRWANPVTRGQASKIVVNSFFAECQTP
jgi:hypothetical protein